MRADTERWQETCQQAEQAARAAGEILLEWRQRFTVTEKSRFNLVTEADFAAQVAITQILQQAYPEHSYLGEEGLESTGADSDHRWIIDPLDGTGNYVHGFPYYCVSIGLEYQGEMVVGVIYDPTRKEMFTAQVGQGAFLNKKPITVSRTEQLEQALCVASLPVNSDPQHPAVARFLRILPHAQSVQRFGSAALNLTSLACGRLDAFWSSTLKSWDMAAGVLIVQEAGGLLSRFDGSPLDIHRQEILAVSSLKLQTELLPLLESD